MFDEVDEIMARACMPKPRARRYDRPSGHANQQIIFSNLPHGVLVAIAKQIRNLVDCDYKSYVFENLDCRPHLPLLPENSLAARPLAIRAVPGCASSTRSQSATFFSRMKTSIVGSGYESTAMVSMAPLKETDWPPGHVVVVRSMTVEDVGPFLIDASHHHLGPDFIRPSGGFLSFDDRLVPGAALILNLLHTKASAVS
ncbi:hypothetical protein AMAG_11718 [Allomyces macrogynus ATCC 38327]|uniref:Uncharacterized protein n=1 Tax=Allomyces macrogynus (strain ATCC 38327) TaxID=578462 RepID=A0A0L0SW83_ALLM3|nr:hypothetical protein AMAG_11718 [Allomyces macrogynus ATCC 38327]|eukprot:KNE66599.1 hypothetical protein AMAG_11718 [Allomyces macrogynus ATCC 38327]